MPRGYVHVIINIRGTGGRTQRTWYGSSGDLVAVPLVQYELVAVEDAVVLLTFAEPR